MTKIKEGQVVKYRGVNYKRIQGAWAAEVVQMFYVAEIDCMIEELTNWRDTVFDSEIVDRNIYSDRSEYELIGWSTETVSDNTAFRINEKIEKERQSKLVGNKKAKVDKERQDRATYERLKEKFSDENM